MEPRVITVDPLDPDPAALAPAVEALCAGRLVAMPTETVYGLAGRADDPAAVAAIFAAKGRPAYNPLIVHVASIEAARALTTAWSPLADTLARAFWPGPLTLVVPRDRARVPDIVAAHGPTVAIRVPAHPVALALLRASGLNLAAPSANRFQRLSPTAAAHVVAGLGGRVSLVLDGGPCQYGIESTVLKIDGETATLLRPGALSVEALRPYVDTVNIAPPVAPAEGGEALPSPGMVAKHYAPETPVWVVDGGDLDEAVGALRRDGVTRIGVLRCGASGALAGASVTALDARPEVYAAGLFAALHALDGAGYEALLVEAVPDTEGWLAVRDRLRRAARVE